MDDYLSFICLKYAPVKRNTTIDETNVNLNLVTSVKFEIKY